MPAVSLHQQDYKFQYSLAFEYLYLKAINIIELENSLNELTQKSYAIYY
jgi:hypothetical protein